MTTIDVNDLTIVQGKTYGQYFRWQEKPIIRKPILGISLATGSPVLHVTAHGLQNGWPFAVMGAKGMVQINAPHNPPEPDDYHETTVVDADHVEMNDVDPFDENGRVWPGHVAGTGFIQYFTPHTLAAYTARMSIKDRVGGTELFSLTTVNGRIVLDDTAKTILLNISATDTAAMTFKKGVYDLEMVSPTGIVTAISTGVVILQKEVTTT